MKSMKKTIAAAVAIAMIFGCVVGGTVAWLAAKTTEVTNTFTVGDININLTETTSDYKMVPGNKIAKDPKVTVEEKSEACWLFVKVEKSDNYNTYLSNPAIAEGWTPMDGSTDPLTGLSGVYYRQVNANDAKAGVSYYVLEGTEGYPNGYVTVNDSVTKTQMETAKTANPTLTFTAYAVQSANISSVTDAWAQAQNAAAPSTPEPPAGE